MTGLLFNCSMWYILYEQQFIIRFIFIHLLYSKIHKSKKFISSSTFQNNKISSYTNCLHRSHIICNNVMKEIYYFSL